MKKNSATRRRIVAATSVAFVLGVAASSCGDDVIDDDVEEDIDDMNDTIESYVDTLFTDTTGG